ncbi:MAG: sulfatase-like hydrolase/transferase, partial [Verrucomicrobiota bacterium]
MRLFALLLTISLAICGYAAEKPNILFITVDDMSCDSVGAYGCELKDTTPHMDKLAAKGLRFEMAHVQVGNCYPSRNVMFSGLYPHTSGVEGFYAIRDFTYPVVCDVMQKNGYLAMIRGKVSHSTPYNPYHWDADFSVAEDGSKEHIKDVESYYRSTQRAIAKSKSERKPFFFNINISDPHKPFWTEKDQSTTDKRTTKIFTGDQVPIPGFLFDDPEVRDELALYYTSVRRADDAVGAILRALEESDQKDNTIVMFLSDHGMPLPFAK